MIFYLAYTFPFSGVLFWNLRPCRYTVTLGKLNLTSLPPLVCWSNHIIGTQWLNFLILTSKCLRTRTGQFQLFVVWSPPFPLSNKVFLLFPSSFFFFFFDYFNPITWFGVHHTWPHSMDQRDPKQREPGKLAVPSITPIGCFLYAFFAFLQLSHPATSLTTFEDENKLRTIFKIV